MFRKLKRDLVQLMWMTAFPFGDTAEPIRAFVDKTVSFCQSQKDKTKLWSAVLSLLIMHFVFDHKYKLDMIKISFLARKVYLSFLLCRCFLKFSCNDNLSSSWQSSMRKFQIFSLNLANTAVFYRKAVLKRIKTESAGTVANTIFLFNAFIWYINMIHGNSKQNQPIW